MFSECVLGKMFNQCRRSVKDLLALERALRLSCVRFRSRLSLVQLFLSFFFCLSFLSSNEFHTSSWPYHLALRDTTEHVFPDLKRSGND